MHRIGTVDMMSKLRYLPSRTRSAMPSRFRENLLRISAAIFTVRNSNVIESDIYIYIIVLQLAVVTRTLYKA